MHAIDEDEFPLLYKPKVSWQFWRNQHDDFKN